MPILTLTARERTELERLARTTQDADQLRRVNALLALDSGQGASHIARTQRVGRSTIYEWVHRFLEHRRGDLDAATTTRTAPGSGLTPPSYRRAQACVNSAPNKKIQAE